MDKRPEVYVSVVVETDGPIPGPYSMIAVGATALSNTGKRIDSTEVCVSPLPGTVVHPTSLSYWKKNIGLREEILSKSEDPVDAMSYFSSWVERLKGKPILAAYNSAWTWMWIHWYTTKYTVCSPFPLTALDLKSQASIFIGREFLKTSKHNLPQSWLSIEGQVDSLLVKSRRQAEMLKGILRARRKLYDYLDLPGWTEKNFGALATENHSRGDDRMGKDT